MKEWIKREIESISRKAYSLIYRHRTPIVSFLIGCLAMLISVRIYCSEPIIREVEVPSETAVCEDTSEEYSEDAAAIARVLYGLSMYHLTDTQKTAVVEVILNRVNDTAREFRTLDSIDDVCNQPYQWQGYDEGGQFLESDYKLVLKRLLDTTGARTIPDTCYFMTVGYATITVRTEFEGGNSWTL